MRIFICSVVPNELILKLNAPQAPNNFCFNLIDNGAFDKTYSLVPPTYYYDGNYDNSLISYLGGAKDQNKFWKSLSAVLNNVKCAWKVRKSDAVWFYNICAVNVIAYIVIHFIFRVPVYTILLDHTPSYSRLSFRYYVPKLFRLSLGMISLSLRSPITHPNFICKAGVMAKEKIQPINKQPKAQSLRFLFSGKLDAITGFPLVLGAFKQLPDIELYVSGLSEVDIEALKAYPNIHYFGYMEYAEYLELYKRVDVCLSLRDPQFEENLNNFPSKILEYFSYGKIVLSTINYPELRGLILQSALSVKKVLLLRLSV